MAKHPYEESKEFNGKPNGTGVPDLDGILQDAIRVGSGIGSTVLAGISDALEQVGDTLAAARTPHQPLPFPQWRQRLDRKLQNGRQSESLAMAITGWALAASFGIAAIVMWALAAAGPQALGVTEQEFLVFPILMACFTPLTVGFGIMGGFGVKKYRYIRRLRRYLRVAQGWVCDVSALARDSALDPQQVHRDLLQAVSGGDLPDAVLHPDDRLYLDISRCAPQDPPQQAEAAAPQTPLNEAESFRQEGTDFLEYLRRSVGKLGADTDEELAQMRKICAAILGFVHNHPDQLPRIRRFREYYLPTTRKLLDTAQGLGETDVQHAQDIRRDITGILHTLNQAYGKLYDTLLQDVSLDVSTEIDTLETMLRQDGLTHDFEMDFKSG